MNKIIIINGPSCGGKTTIAKEICSQSENKFVHLQIDEAKKYLFTILDSKSTPREIGRPICDEILLQTAEIFLRNGKNIVIDTTFDGDERENVITTAEHYIAFFKNAEVLFVGINCSVEERLRRFKENNNNPVRNEATIIAQSNVFELCKELYDIWFDSSLLSGKELASNILHHTEHLTKNNETILVRPSTSSDIDVMVLLSRAKRRFYEKAQPQFWKYAGEEGDNTQRIWFKELLVDKNYLMFTATSHCEPKSDKAVQENNDNSIAYYSAPNNEAKSSCDERLLGFVIGKLIPAPEVYNPGGLTLMVDDFYVKSKNLWKFVGARLIEAVNASAKVKGASQILVVCGAHDHPKRKFLNEQNLQVASEWFVGGIA